MLRLAGHTLATPELGLLNAVRLFAQLGLGGVEIVQDDDYPSGLPNRPTKAQVRELGHVLADAGLEAVHLTPYVRTLDALEEAERNRAVESSLRSIEVAASLGAGGIRILAGRRDGAGMEERRDRFARSMRELAAVAEPAGVSLNIESKGWSFAGTSGELHGLLAVIDSSAVGVLFDPGNLLLDGLDPVLALESQRALVRHVHLKDLRLKAGGAYEFTGLGSGQVPWPVLLQRLGAGFQGWFSFEHERRWHADLPAASDWLPAELPRLQRLMGF